MENSKQITRFRWRDARELEKTMNVEAIPVDFSSLPRDDDGYAVLDMTTCKSNRVTMNISGYGYLHILLPVAGVLNHLNSLTIDTVNQGNDILVFNDASATKELKIFVIGNFVILADNDTIIFDL